MWWSYNFEWASVDAKNGGGGLLCLWDSDFFQKETVIKNERWICVKGFI